jgi:hypothetical protein
MIEWPYVVVIESKRGDKRFDIRSEPQWAVRSHLSTMLLLGTSTSIKHKYRGERSAKEMAEFREQASEFRVFTSLRMYGAFVKYGRAIAYPDAERI